MTGFLGPLGAFKGGRARDVCFIIVFWEISLALDPKVV
jgi:hypothetical protein